MKNRNVFLKYKIHSMGDGDGGGGGGDGGQGGGDGGAGGGGEGGGGSAISGGSDLPLNEYIPEKFRVFDDGDGEGAEKVFNLEGTTRKLAQSYLELEKNGGAPESPEGYEINAENFGDEFDVNEFMAQDSTKGFLKRMHAKGLNNSQVQEVLEYGLKEWAPELMQGKEELTSEQSIQHMKSEVWKDPQEYTQNMNLANRAFLSLPEDLQAEVDQKLGNDPVFLKVAALFGKEMKEDTSTQEETNMTETAEVEKIMLSDAYKDPKHPDHEKVSKQVKAYYEKKFPGNAA
jgi:hypothetical protein